MLLRCYLYFSKDREASDREEDCGLSEVQGFEDANSAVVCPLILAYFLGECAVRG